MEDDININLDTSEEEAPEEESEDTQWRNQFLLAMQETSNLQQEILSELQRQGQNQVSEATMRTLLETNTSLTGQLATMAAVSIQNPSTVVVETPPSDTQQAEESESAPLEVVAEELPPPVTEVPRPKRRRI